MKQSHKLAVGVIASLGIAVGAAVVHAHPGQMGGGMGQQHMKGGMEHGAQGGMRHGMQGGHEAPAAAQRLMTPEERTALIEKMRNARTPEERQQIAAANHAEMQKRAQEKGVTLPERRGLHAGHGPRAGIAPQAPAATE